MEQIFHAIDCSLNFTNPGQSMCLLTGWLKGAASLVAVSPQHDRAAAFDCFFLPRPDVDAIYGPCDEGRKTQYGFWALALGDMRFYEFSLFARNENKLTHLQDLPPECIRDFASGNDFMEALTSIPLRWEEVLPVYGHFAGSVEACLQNWQKQREESGALATQEFGDIPDAPTYSIIVPLRGHASHVIPQLVAFSLDRNLLEKAEILYVNTVPSRHYQELANGHALFHSPMRLYEPGLDLGAAQAWRLGAAAARGKYVLFASQNAIPQKAGLLEDMAHELEARQDLFALSCVDCKRLQNANYREIHPDIMDRLRGGPDSSLDRLQKTLRKESMLFMPRQNYIVTGGFDCSCFHESYALAALVGKMRLAGHNVGQMEEESLAFMETPLLINDDSARIRREMWDLTLYQRGGRGMGIKLRPAGTANVPCANAGNIL